MAKFSDVNTIVVNAVDAIFRLKEQLVAAGWVVNQSSDGSTYNAAGDQIAAYTDLDNTNAWFEIQEPETNGRSWIFQRVSNEDDWYVKISVAAGFSGGTPGITQVPSATDEFLIQGTGTDAAPNGTAMFPTPGQYRWHVIAQSTPAGPAGNRAYGFWAFSTAVATGGLSACICQEPLAEGTYPVLTGTRLVPTGGEPEPCVYVCVASAFALTLASQVNSWAGNVGNNAQRGFFDYAGGAQALVRWAADRGNMHLNLTGHLQAWGTGQHAKHVGQPIHIARNTGNYATEIGDKGYTAFLKQRGLAESYPSTVALASDAHVYAGEMLVPWPDNVVPEM